LERQKEKARERKWGVCFLALHEPVTTPHKPGSHLYPIKQGDRAYSALAENTSYTVRETDRQTA